MVGHGGVRRRSATLGVVYDLWTAWHAPSFAEDVELNFAQNGG
jgi:hypothetical protein